MVERHLAKVNVASSNLVFRFLKTHTSVCVFCFIQRVIGMKRILSIMRSTIQKYNMINEGDRIAAAVSGGKDSMVMLEALRRLREFYPQKFELGAICIDIGFEGADFSDVENYCRDKAIECHVEKTVIKTVVFDKMKEKSPCSLCARMRRAALCNTAEKLGYNKIALGHNREDANETLLMNIFKNGKIECFEPVTDYDDKNICIIRPMVAVPEGLMAAGCKRNGIPVTDKVCPVDGYTDRQWIKNMIKEMSAENKNLAKNIFASIEKHECFASKVHEVKNK